MCQAAGLKSQHRARRGGLTGVRCCAQVRRQNEDLAHAREQQKLQKAKVLSDQARQQQEQFFRIIDAQVAAADEEAATERHAAELRRLHKEEARCALPSRPPCCAFLAMRSSGTVDRSTL